MAGYLAQRLLAFPLLLLTIYAAAVLLIMAAPGDGLSGGEKDLPEEVLAQKRAAFNYDEPWWQRYFWTWPKRLVWDGDLPAHQYEDWTVTEIIRTAAPVSLQLGALALALAFVLGVGTGVTSAVSRGVLGHASSALSVVGISLPTFAVGAGLLIVFGLWLRAVPIGGWGRMEQALLPALTLALPYAAYLARLTRAGLLEALEDDYVRTARAKGLSPARVLFVHALPAALLPVLSYLGPAAAAIFTGSFVVEQVFTIPGLGTHVVQSIHNRDHSLILAIVLLYGALLASFNLLVDLMYGLADPRIRTAGAPLEVVR